MKKSALVILGNGTQGLGIVRSAGNSGIQIIQINDKHISAARFSRYLSKYIRLYSNFFREIANNPEGCSELIKILLDLNIDQPSVLLGTNEDINEFIYSNKTLLEKKYFIPANEYELIFDKFLFNRLLPLENQIETYLDSPKLFFEFKNSNYILKGRKGNKFKNISGKKAILLNEISDEFHSKLVEKIGKENLVVQKIIDGNFPVQSVCAFSEQGEIKGLFIYEKLRQHPDRFGTGTYLRSIESNDVLKIAEIILKKLKYTGISEIEFILDPIDNKFKVIEMNPRTWKSINFATQCSQNIVMKYIDYATGKKIKSSNYYTTDKYWTDLFADFSQMIREHKIFPYHFNNMYECTWEKTDPLPFVFSLLLLPLVAFKI